MGAGGAGDSIVHCYLDRFDLWLQRLTLDDEEEVAQPVEVGGERVHTVPELLLNDHHPPSLTSTTQPHPSPPSIALAMPLGMAMPACVLARSRMAQHATQAMAAQPRPGGATLVRSVSKKGARSTRASSWSRA